MDIVEVDASTAPDEVLEQIYLVESEASAELLGSAPAPTLAERVARYRNPGTGLRWRWLVHADHEPAGLAELQVHSETFAIGDVLVRPAFRRRGIGRALFDVMCGAAREHSIPSFFGHHGSEAGAGFAAAVGARADLRDVKSVLDLQEAELPAPPVGLELRTWIGPVPDELMETFVAARNAMNDAPTPGGIGDIPWTIERQRDDDATLVARGTPPYTTVVLDGGEVVAFTAVRVQEPPCPYVTTDDTAVIPSHRGRGLAYAVKLENLRRVREARPDVERVGTMNAEHNHAMRAVNTKLGFVPTVYLTTAVVELRQDERS
ncbi:MAG TPA: GNAT family N-acetyltransferase [Gaiellaceae bacterium]|nr:GNAT family N-acetyltransferase [Gaiellaceae bacterium]